MYGITYDQPKTLTIRIINMTGSNQKLNLMIDNQQIILTCDVEAAICDETLETCPQLIETISEQRYDSSGVFVGGRSFQDTPAFVFTQGGAAPTGFTCGDVLIYRFTPTLAEAIIE